VSKTQHWVLGKQNWRWASTGIKLHVYKQVWRKALNAVAYYFSAGTRVETHIATMASSPAYVANELQRSQLRHFEVHKMLILHKSKRAARFALPVDTPCLRRTRCYITPARNHEMPVTHMLLSRAFPHRFLRKLMQHDAASTISEVTTLVLLRRVCQSRGVCFCLTYNGSEYVPFS
jgi:hypothetical protein